MPIHGWLILNKPTGMTSAKAVAKVKHLLCLAGADKETKVGHAGTLDPLASGLLPLAIGEATKTVSYAMDGRKSYFFRLTWGQERSTDDAEGEITATSASRPARAQVEAILPLFIGQIQQIPPAYSAIKISGQRAYARVRAGEAVEMQPRFVYVENMQIVDFNEKSAGFFVHCGKGTYIRSLGRDIARALGTCGYVSELVRNRVGKFGTEQAISLEKLEELVHKGELAACLYPVESVLDDIPAWKIDSANAKKLAHGGVVAFDPGEMAGIESGDIWQALHEGRLVALTRFERGVMSPLRVFNLGG